MNAKTKAYRITHWNYRVLTESNDGESWSRIVEVYYHDDDLLAWCESSLIGDDPHKLASTLRQMVKVADLATLKSDKHRALTPDDFPAGPVPPRKDADT